MAAKPSLLASIKPVFLDNAEWRSLCRAALMMLSRLGGIFFLLIGLNQFRPIETVLSGSIGKDNLFTMFLLAFSVSVVIEFVIYRITTFRFPSSPFFSSTELEGFLGNQSRSIRFVGLVPELLNRKGNSTPDKTELKTFEDAFGTIRTALNFGTPRPFPRSILVTSSKRGEGKTRTSVELSKAIASIGYMVLLVDANLRNGKLHRRIVGIQDELGFGELLEGTHFANCIQSADISNLSVVTRGKIDRPSGDLLASGVLFQFLSWAKQFFHVVIFDGPQIQSTSDAVLLSRHVELNIVVVERGATQRTSFMKAISQFDNQSFVVLNKSDPQETYSSYEYYYFEDK
jgi:capsular exopolysaccharide synthesis family protein